MIGKKHSDPSLQSDLENLKWPFTVHSDNDRPTIQIKNFQNKTQYFSPEQISSSVLNKMKSIAEEFHLGHGKTLDQAVITVPAYFNDDQKQATIVAARLAGLNVLRLLSEPSAAGLAFCYQRLKKNLYTEQNILVYDLGGGTFDVSIMQMIGGRIDVKVTSGDTHLGGNDFDGKLIDFCVRKFEEDTGEDISSDRKALWKLRTACITAKELLSSDEIDKHE